MLCNVVLVSTIQQCESAIIYTYPLPLEPLSHSTLIRPSRLSQSTSWASYIIQHLLTSCLHMTMHMFQCSTLNLFHPLFQLFEIAELFKNLKNDAIKVLHSLCQWIWKTQQWPRTGKGHFSSQSQRKAMPKNVQITIQLHSFLMPARLCSKSFKLGFSSM